MITTEKAKAVELLAASAIFETCTKGEIGKLLKYFDRVELQPGEVIFAQGTAQTNLYHIYAGEVSITDSGLGDESTLGAGDFFGEVGLIGESANSYSEAQTTKLTTLFVLSSEQFHALIKRYPATACKILFRLTRIIGIRQTVLNEMQYAHPELRA